MYDTSFSSSALQGELVKYVNAVTKEGNNAKAGQLAWQFSDYVTRKEAAGHARIVRYIEVTYEDRLGENHEEVYYVDTTHARRLSDAEGKGIVEEFHKKESKGQSIDFDEPITPELVHQVWASIVDTPRG